MPNRNKKLSPEQLEKLFFEWKEGKESDLINEIVNELKEFEEINETTSDFVNKYQNLLNMIARIPQTFKIKKSFIKSISHEHVRTAFFGGISTRIEPFKIDDTDLDFPNKEVPHLCRHVKLAFLKLLKEITFEELEPENFIEWRKNKMVTAVKEFGKLFKEHIKKGHQDTKLLMIEALDPLIKLMKANMKLVTFEMSLKDYDKLMKNFFLYKAKIIDFCRFYQPCQNILFK